MSWGLDFFLNWRSPLNYLLESDPEDVFADIDVKDRVLKQTQRKSRRSRHTKKQKQIEEKQEIHECVVCLNAKSTRIIIPCMHFCLCETCSLAFKRKNMDCPKCRAKIRMICKVYF